jgi:hypothetical protein
MLARLSETMRLLLFFTQKKRGNAEKKKERERARKIDGKQRDTENVRTRTWKNDE